MSDTTKLREELREARTDYDGTIMPDRAEPIGVDCGLLRRAEETADRADALEAGLRGLVAKWREESTANGDDLQRGDSRWETADELSALLNRPADGEG